MAKNKILVNESAQACTQGEPVSISESGTKWYACGAHQVTESGSVKILDKEGKTVCILTKDALAYVATCGVDFTAFYNSSAYQSVLLVKSRKKQEEKLKKELARKIVSGLSADELLAKLGYTK